MKAHCYLCHKEVKHGEDYISINKGNHSEEGDKDWAVLIFHDACWAKLGKKASGQIGVIFQVEA